MSLLSVIPKTVKKVEFPCVAFAASCLGKVQLFGRFWYILFSFLAFSKVPLEALYCYDGDPTYEECPYPCIEDIRLNGGYYLGKFISIDQSYGQFGFVKPLSVFEEDRPFIDAEAYIFNDHKWAASGGVGYRVRTSYSGVAGLNVYYDYRRGQCSSFNQVGAGIEWLSDSVDVTLNGYLPVGKSTKRNNKKFEYAYSGFDGSIGTALYSYRGYNLYAYVGTYYLTHDYQKQFWGGFGGVDLDWKSLIIVKLRFSNDRIYSKTAQGIFMLSIPLDLFYCASAQECYCGFDLFSMPVRRIGMILLGKSKRYIPK